MVKSLTKIMFGITLVAMAAIIIFNYAFHISRSHKQMQTISESYFQQLTTLIDDNQRGLDVALEEFSDSALRRARTASYVIESRSELEHDPEGLQELAEILDVDEIHLFSPAGEIYSGTHPEYYHLFFTSGEQMSFFLPMLQDRSLELCQDITPNTAEHKLMQYAAVWRSDGKGIIQIGLVPERILKIKKENELSNIISVLPSERGIEFYLLSAEDETILATTLSNRNYQGRKFISLPWQESDGEIQVVHRQINGEKYCVFFQKLDEHIYVRAYPSRYTFQEAFVETSFVSAYILLLGIVTLLMLWQYTRGRVIRGLQAINEDMQRMESGAQAYVREIPKIPELNELSGAINRLSDSIRSAFQNFSLAVDNSKLQMGVYDYNPQSDRFFVSEQVWRLLRLDTKKRDIEQLRARIREMKQHPCDLEQHIFRFGEENAPCYIHIETFSYNQHEVMLFIDVTSDYSDKEKIRFERDRDYLTGLYTRRAFIEQVESRFGAPEKLGSAAILMIDADSLKTVNDQHGHQAGDQYLKQIAGLLIRETPDGALCSRLGGDEFAILLSGFEDDRQLSEAIARLAAKDGQERIMLAGTDDIPLQFSLGAAFYRRDGGDYHQLLKHADERMYANKARKHQAEKNGRNDPQPGR